MYNGLYEDETYKKLKEKSTTGESGKRTGEIVRIKKSTYRNNIKIIAVATALATSLIIGGGAKAYEKLQKNATINSLAYDFRTEVISPETHRTMDNQHYYYDYDDIADKIEAMDNPDIGYFLFYKNTGTYQTDKVMQETRFRSFDAYLEEHNFANAKEFSEKMAEITLLDNEVKEKENKLDSLVDDIHKSDDDNSSYGGKK